MRLRIHGWRCENVRGNLQNVDLDLGDPLPQWTLVQMPNGTGKTTTMALFRHALSGHLPTLEELRGFRPADDTSQGLFEVRLSLDAEQYRLQLKLGYQQGESAFFTARRGFESGGLKPGWHLPEELHRLLTPDFTRLFVFDGELAKQIRDTSKEEAARAIRTLYKLNDISALKKRIDEIVNAKVAAASTKSKQDKGVTQHRNKVAEADQKLKSLVASRDDIQRELQALKKQAENIQARIGSRVDQDAGLKAQKQELEARKRTLEGKLEGLVASSMALYRSPTWLHDRILARLNNLGQKLQVLKLPKMSSQEFFKELSEQKECICGRSIREQDKQYILRNAERFLGQDQIAVINAMKQAVRRAEADPRRLGENVHGLREAEHGLRKVSGDLTALEAERLAAGDSELEQLKATQETVRLQTSKLEERLLPLTTKDPFESLSLDRSLTWENNIPLCEAELKQRRRVLEEATETRQLNLQARLVQRLLDRIVEHADRALRDRVRSSTNQKLERLVPSERLVVSRIGDALEIGSTGTQVKGGVSEGQSLAVAYAFLTSLLQDAPYTLPFIVDSPAVSLDNRVRREVGDLIPTLFDQMIMFVISSEREGFADAFYDKANVKFFTVSKGASGTQVEEGIKAFKAFHS